jgi:hypothetical protein
VNRQHLTLGARGCPGESSESARPQPNAMGVRRQTAEHPFGTTKCWMRATHFLTKELPKVATETVAQRARLQHEARDGD